MPGMSKNVKTPASQCKAKGGPTTCPYHSKAIIREMDSEIDNLSESISLMQSEKTKSSGLEADRLQSMIIKAERILIMADDKKKKKLSLYDRMKCNMVLVDNFINCMNGYGSAATMTEQQKRDFVNQYTIEDVEILYYNDFI